LVPDQLEHAFVGEKLLVQALVALEACRVILAPGDICLGKRLLPRTTATPIAA